MSKAPIDIMLDQVDWKEVPIPENHKEDGLYATHTGVLKVGNYDLTVHVLNTGVRVFDADSLESLFGDELFKDELRSII